ncbi:MAG: RidA family protein [candidate division KSB1 bacterium]|nr:RidA family protein [candidate division KSB1 bacterium]MDZ7301326.1 RidA family protein [candidate division KSB1 bacterium]MDZ7310789.1 RidA family protein [candidate division KSB1 bacterium]
MRRLLLILPLIFWGCDIFQQVPITREVIDTREAPKAIGPYSQAIKIGNVLYCSGQIGLDTAGVMVGGDIQDETRQVLKNIGAILRAGGMDYKDVVNATVYLANLDDYKVINEVYAEFFKENKPARAAIQIARLPRDARVEISCVAVKLE